MTANTPTPVSPFPADVGEKTVVMKIPYALWKWASDQARIEKSNLTAKTEELYLQWYEEAQRAVRAAAAAQAKPPKAQGKATAKERRKKKV